MAKDLSIVPSGRIGELPGLAGGYAVGFRHPGNALTSLTDIYRPVSISRNVKYVGARFFDAHSF
jgi:hypothetical protein